MTLNGQIEHAIQPVPVKARPSENGSTGSGSSHDLTRLLGRWHGGDDEALDEVLPLVYNELRRLAGRYLNQERGQTLQTHDLIHEAFLRLIGQRHVDWQNRAHFFGIAALMMRRILTDHARRRACGKHGGAVRRMLLEDVPDFAATTDAGIVAVTRRWSSSRSSTSSSLRSWSCGSSAGSSMTKRQRCWASPRSRCGAASASPRPGCIGA